MTDEITDIDRKLVTIISADVDGYSRLMAEDEEATLKTFRAHKLIFTSIVVLHKGRVFNTAGDAILAEFNSAVEAVRCATEIQSALRTRNDKLARNRQVQFRIGVNIGDVIVQGADLLGDGVNIAARIQTMAAPGGVSISGSVYDQIQNKLSLSVYSLGEKNYKNIPHSVRTFSIREADGIKIASKAKSFSNAVSSLFPFWKTAAVCLVVLLAFGRIAFFLSKTIFVSQVFNQEANRKLASEPPHSSASLSPDGSMPVPTAIDKTYFDYKNTSTKTAFIVDQERGTGSTHATIKEAIDSAKDGEAIDVRPGIYREAITISKNVIIRGLPNANGKLGVRIESKGAEAVGVFSGKVVLENLALILSAEKTAATPSTIFISGGQLVLRNVFSFSGGEFPSPAFSIRAGDAIAEKSTFTGSRGIEHLGGTLKCIECSTVNSRDEGVVVFNQENAPEFTSIFQNLHSSNNRQMGFAVMDNAKVEINGCQISENGINGIQTTGNGKVVISQCEVNKNKENGLVAAGTSKIEFSQGKLSHNGYSGAAGLDNASIIVRKSELTANGEYGFATLNNAKASSDDNKISGNRSGTSYRAPASTDASTHSTK